MEFHRPKGVLAGFHVLHPDAGLPELIHIGEQWAPAEFFIAEHSHKVWEFYYQIAGASTWVGDSKSYELKPGSFFAAGPGVVHRMLERPKAKHHFLFAAIDVEAICDRQREFPDFWRKRRLVFSPSGEAVEAHFRLLIREVSSALAYRTTGMRIALEGLLIAASRLLTGRKSERSFISSHPAVVRAKEVLDQHPGEHWKLSELARLAGLSPSRFSECFLQDTGFTPHQYLLRMRIDKAKEALRHGDVSLTDLALDLGFSSSQHFATVFKRMTGLTAHRFRKHGQAV